MQVLLTTKWWFYTFILVWQRKWKILRMDNELVAPTFWMFSPYSSCTLYKRSLDCCPRKKYVSFCNTQIDNNLICHFYVPIDTQFSPWLIALNNLQVWKKKFFLLLLQVLEMYLRFFKKKFFNYFEW